MEVRKRYIGGLDGLSVAVSLLCLVHCVALPLLVSVLPLWRITALQDARIEWATLGLTLLIGGWAIRKGYKHHHQKSIFALFLAGVSMVALGSFFDDAEMALKGAGAACVIFAHLRNWSQSCRSCAVHQATEKIYSR